MRTDIFHASAAPAKESGQIFFDEFGEICGSADKITIDLAMELGKASAGVAARIAVGYSDCTICRLLAGAFVSGAAASGAQVTEFGSCFFAAASYLARSYLFNLMVFFENDGHRFCVRITDKFGLPIDENTKQQINRSSTSRYVGLADVIMPKSILGTLDVFTAAMSKRGALSHFKVAVSGTSSAVQTLKSVISSCGGEVINPKHGICELSVSDDGMRLFLRDENGRWYDDAHVSAACVFLHFASGEKSLAVPPDAPGIVEQIANEYDGRIFRIGRDATAREIYISQEILCNAIGDAVALLCHIADSGTTAEKLFSALPDFTLISREVGLRGDRKLLLEKLSDACRDMYSENTGSLRICTDGGWVNIRPSHSASSLRITGEGMNEEIASELCNLFVEKTSTMDNSPDK